MISELLIFTTIYTWGYCTRPSHTVRPTLLLSAHSPTTHSCSSYASFWWHRSSPTWKSFYPHCPTLAWALTAATVLNTPQLIKSFKDPGQHVGLFGCLPNFPSSLLFALPCVPPAQSWSSCQKGAPAGPLTHLGSYYYHSYDLRPFFSSLLSASCYSEILLVFHISTQVLSPLRECLRTPVWVYCVSDVFIHSFNEYFLSSHYTASIRLHESDTIVSKTDTASALTELSI